MYRNMKKLAAGMFLGIVFSVAVFFVLNRFLGWEWELPVTISLCALAIAYAVYRVKLYDKGTSVPYTHYASKATGFGIVTLYTGLLFESTSWAGSTVIFMVSLVSTFGIAMVSYIYPNLKKLEKITVAFFGLLFAVAVIFMVNRFPLWQLLTAVSLGALAIVYAICGVRFFDDGTFALRTTASKAIGLGLSAIFIGSLFKIMFWNGGQSILIIGLAVTFAIATVSFLYRSQNDFFKTIVLRVAIIGGLGLLVCFASDATIFKTRWSDCPSCVEAFKNYCEVSRGEALRQARIEYWRTNANSELEFRTMLHTNGIFEDVKYK